MEPPLDDFVYHDDHHPDHYDFARLDAGDMTAAEEAEFFKHLGECAPCAAAFAAWVKDGRPSALDNDT